MNRDSRLFAGPHSVAFLLFAFFAPAPAFGQLAPGLGYAYPPVVNVGARTPVQLGGFDLTPDVQWFVHRDDVQLEVKGPAGDFLLPPPPYWIGPRGGTNALPIPREVPAEVTVSADAVPGPVRFQVANANGSSRTAVMYLSNDVEVIETRSRDFPQRLPNLPIGVSGRLSRLTEVDRYQFTADRDGTVTVQLLARKLGSDFRALIEVHDAKGNMVGDFSDTYGVDGEFSFSANAGVEYTVSIHDADFRGDQAYVYHLALSYGARPAGILPAKVQRGVLTEAEVFLKQSEDSDEVQVRRSLLVAQENTLPTVVLPKLSDNAGNSEVTWRGTLEVPVSDLPQFVEQTLRNSSGLAADLPVPLAGPCGVSGRLSGRTSAVFTFSATVKEHWLVQLEPTMAECDLLVRIVDPEGKVVAENDDFENSMTAQILFVPPKDGTYQCVVEVLSAVASANGYYLELRRTTPDFALRIPQQIQIGLGATTEVSVQAIRSGGMTGEISIQFEGLPVGVTVPENIVIPSDQNTAKVVLTCQPDSAVAASAIRVTGRAKLIASNSAGTESEQLVTQTALAAMSGILGARTYEDTLIDRALLSITMPPPIDVLVVDRERQRDVPRGSTYLAELQIVRKEGFAGEVTLVMSAQQSRNRQGIRGQTVTVPPGETSAFYPCFMPEWLATDITRRIVVHGIAVVSDPKGNLRYLTRPGDARITMIMEGALMKLGTGTSEFETECGGRIEVPVTISRTVRMALPVTVDLKVPEEAKGKIHATPVTFQPDQHQGILTIAFENVHVIKGPWTLRLAATALQDGQWPVVSETEITVEVR